MVARKQPWQAFQTPIPGLTKSKKRKTPKKDGKKLSEHKEKSGRPRSDGDESDEQHQSKKLKNRHKDRDTEEKSKHKHRDKEESREAQELKAILEAGFSSVEPSQYGSKNRFDPDRRYREKKREEKKKTKENNDR